MFTDAAVCPAGYGALGAHPPASAALIPRPPPGYLHTQEGRPGLPRSQEGVCGHWAGLGPCPGETKCRGSGGPRLGLTCAEPGAGQVGGLGFRCRAQTLAGSAVWAAEYRSLGLLSALRLGPFLPRGALGACGRQAGGGSLLPSEARDGGRALSSSRPRRKEGFSWLLHATRCFSLMTRAVRTGSWQKMPENNKEEN